jgi:hypothetical protein
MTGLIFIGSHIQEEVERNRQANQNGWTIILKM